jgi:hypothetical protein
VCDEGALADPAKTMDGLNNYPARNRQRGVQAIKLVKAPNERPRSPWNVVDSSGCRYFKGRDESPGRQSERPLCHLLD